MGGGAFEGAGGLGGEELVVVGEVGGVGLEDLGPLDLGGGVVVGFLVVYCFVVF